MFLIPVAREPTPKKGVGMFRITPPRTLVQQGSRILVSFVIVILVLVAMAELIEKLMVAFANMVIGIDALL